MINETSLVDPLATNAEIEVMDEIDKPTEMQSASLRRRDAHARQIVYLDLSDLMEYAKHNGTLSGI